MKAWFIPVEGEVEEITIDKKDALHEAKERFIHAWCDLPRVKYNGKLSHMAVDDEGMLKKLPINKIATKAYWANCRPGTTHPICGPAVIFDGLLP